MIKIILSNNELNKFLLLGEENSYVIDKINPSIRVFKRNKYLSFFCTVRIQNKTTTVKLGNYPENKIEEVYKKFSVAQKIAKEGNNPNLIFKNITEITGDISFPTNKLSFETLLKLFIAQKKASGKYKSDFSNTLTKNLKLFFSETINKFRKEDLSFILQKLLKDGKKGTANNVLNYFLTLCNFGMMELSIKYRDDLIKISKQIKIVKKSFSSRIKNEPKKKFIKLKNKIEFLSEEQASLIEKKVDKMLEIK